jgi:hypothetical protein
MKIPKYYYVDKDLNNSKMLCLVHFAVYVFKDKIQVTCI